MPSWTFYGSTTGTFQLQSLDKTNNLKFSRMYIGFRLPMQYLKKPAYVVTKANQGSCKYPMLLFKAQNNYPIPSFAGLLLDLLPPTVEEQERPRGEHLGWGAGGGQGLCWEPSKDRCAGPVIPQALVAGSWCAAMGILTSWFDRDICYNW